MQLVWKTLVEWMLVAVVVVERCQGDAGTMPLTLMDQSKYPNAKCLDHTPTGYYMARGSPDHWAFYLEGGGLCDCTFAFHYPCFDDCEHRVRTRLGSSKYWEQTKVPYAIVSGDSETNPDFYNWTRVFIPYCTGDLHSGTRCTPAPITSNLVFCGHLSFMSIIDELLQKGLSSAAHVPPGTDNYGPAITLSQVPNADLRGLPAAGFFLEVQPFSGEGIVAKYGRLMALALPVSVPACVDAHNVSYCSNVNVSIPYLKKIFIAENLYDKDQLYDQDGLSHNSSDPAVIAYIQEFGRTMDWSIRSVLAKRSDFSAFTINCVLHGVGFDHNQTVNGQVWSLRL